MALVPCLLLRSGCMLVGPDYKTPSLEASAGFANQAQEGLSTHTAESACWRGFQDDRLNQLVELALENNHVRAADARTEVAFARYEQRVLLALEETANALVDLARQQARRDSLYASAQAGAKAQTVALQRYQFGVIDFLTVLDAERTLLDVEDRLAGSETSTATALMGRL